uniref:Leukocyte elastase inhibitor-like n=1 Tax=Fundulus heteroclitus TaxID=8078 RepID=A0A3Q2TGP8_FUNHE
WPQIMDFSLAKANTSFSLALLRKLSEDNKTANIFFSPFSISSALAMVMLGARGNTATQISECSKIQDCQDDVHSLFAKLLRDLNQPGGPFALSVANRLYGEQTYSFLQVRKSKHHELHLVEKCVIVMLLRDDAVDNMTRMVLVNAIYFKGTWDQPFPKVCTFKGKFRLNKKETKPVAMMQHISVFPNTSIPEVNCQILEMPYKGKELSMLIILPENIEDDTTGLEKLEKHLTYENFMEWTHPDKMKISGLEVMLPRFKLEEAYDLKEVLSSMGMKDAFDETKCDFFGMSGCKELFLSKVSHKAFVEVNEEGTEAAATTWFGENLCGRPMFLASNPFLFFIRHNPTMSVLFAGRFCYPVEDLSPSEELFEW